ncbi:MAG: tetratricopeptide repeat protein [Woeseiaceae bacterium]
MSSDNKKTSLFEELKRRNVYRVGVAYAVLTWLILQAIDTVSPLLSLPDFAPKLALTILAIGFPAVLLFAWAFELTPEGIKREKHVDRKQSITSHTGQRLDRIIIGVLVIAVGMLLVDKFFLAGETQTQEVLATSEMPTAVAEEDVTPSIAVLPFVNMSDDKSSTYFSDGLADTMLHMLAQISEIRVAARTSSFQFRDQTMDITSIGNQLNVATVLEGSVQRAGDKIRVTAQLIDVENGFHLWSGNFDRDLVDVFAIQDEIADEVVAALKVSLLGETAGTLDSDQTENLEAYTEYLLGVNALNESSMENFSRATAHLQKAVEYDPNYARAWSTLGRTYLEMEDYGILSRDEAIAAARDTASQALDLAPESSEALAVLGKTELLEGNLETAEGLLSKAIELGPNDALALTYFGEFLMSDARPSEAVPVFEKAARLDPLSELTLYELANLYGALRRFDDFEAVLDRIDSINPESANTRGMRSALHGFRGEYAMAINYMKEAQAADPLDPEPSGQVAILYLAAGMPSEAQRWFDRGAEIDPEHPLTKAAPLFMDFHTRENREQSARLARQLLEEEIEIRRGARFIAVHTLYTYSLETENLDSFLEVMDNLYPHLFDEPPHSFDRSWLGVYYVGMAFINNGDRERGAMFLQAGQDRRDQFEEAYNFVALPGIESRLALGDPDAALRRLNGFSADMFNDEHNHNLLKHDAIFDPIREDPAFIALLEQYERNAAEQRRLIQAANEN